MVIKFILLTGELEGRARERRGMSLRPAIFC
jgi:hypothetical protein